MMECTGISWDGGFYDGIFGSLSEDGGMQESPEVIAYLGDVKTSKQRSFTFSVDLSSGVLEFRKLGGELLGLLDVGCINIQVRLCAIVGYPGQSLQIIP